MGTHRSLKQRLRGMLLPSRLMPELEAMRLRQGRILVELIRPTSARHLQRCEFSVYSQWGEDGIIQKLISEIPIAHKTFIEFGVEDFSEANCRFLLMNDNWRGYVLDSSAKSIASLEASPWWWKYDLRAKCAMVTRDTVNELLSESGFDSDLGILSIDVDGVDYWLFEAIEAFRPRIVIVEYNAIFGSERKISVPYEASFSRRAKHYSELYFGASLAALAHIAAKKGYALIGTESAGVNAFFLRNDLVTGNVPSLTPQEAFTATRVRQSRDPEGRLTYLDHDGRFALIKGMPVVNVETGELEPL
jgi:hypothetical protein